MADNTPANGASHSPPARSTQRDSVEERLRVSRASHLADVLLKLPEEGRIVAFANMADIP
jgi:hypothetical protein